MPKPNFNFTISLSGTIITVLGSTQPKHPNAKTLHDSLFSPNPRGLEINNATHKFLKK
jgi:hypothetical protein